MSELNKIVTNFPMSLTDEENRNLALTLSAVVEGGGGGGGSADAIWKPAVNEDGIVTWTWDENPNPLIPPASANIKGPRGESGTPGRDGTNGTNGTNGVDGKTPQIQINSSNAHWEWRYSGASEWTDLGVVASGAVGPQGIPGVSGASGAPGAKGEDGFSPTVELTEIDDPEYPQGGWNVKITDAEHQAGQTFQIFNGIDGQGASIDLNGGTGIQVSHQAGTTDYTISVSGGNIPTLSAGYAQNAANATSADVAMNYYDTMDHAPISLSQAINALYNSLDQCLYISDLMPDNGISGSYNSQAQEFELGLTETVYNAIRSVSGKLDSSAAAETYQPKGTYATETYANNASANALSEAEAWVGEQGFLKSVPAEYATETYANNASANALAESKSWVNQQNFATSADLATRVMIPDSADVNLKDKYLVLRTKADGTVDGWTDFQDKTYSKTEADGRYMRKETDSTLEGVGTSADKLRISDTVIDQIENKSHVYMTSAGNVSVENTSGTVDANFVQYGQVGNRPIPRMLLCATADTYTEIVENVLPAASGMGAVIFVIESH